MEVYGKMSRSEPNEATLEESWKRRRKEERREEGKKPLTNPAGPEQIKKKEMRDMEERSGK